MSSSYFVSRNSCPVCQSSSLKTIYQSPFDESPIKDYLIEFYSPQGKIEPDYLKGAVYILNECNNCDLIFQKDVPNNVLMERLYEHWIDPKKALIEDQQEGQSGRDCDYQQEIKQIIAFLKNKKQPLKFFDFGLGWGAWAATAKELGCDAYGTEISEERIKHAKSLGIEVISWDEIPNYQFDFINTEQVFEHLADPRQTFEQLKKALKPEGLLKISVPTANDIARRLRIMDWKAPKNTRNSLNPVAPLEHINFFRRGSVIKMANLAGIKEVQIPLRLQYQYSGGYTGVKRVAKNLLLPVYRNILKRQNYLIFSNQYNNRINN